MGLLDFLHKDEIVGTKILVCGIDSRSGALAQQDADTYKRYYPSTISASFLGADEFMHALNAGYDVVHVFCDVGPTGALGGSRFSGTDLIEKCCASGVKLLWIASDNDPKGYIAGFKAGGKRLNLEVCPDFCVNGQG